jgi:hypothetical protein
MDNRIERQRFIGKREIEPDIIIINGIEYRKVVPEKEEPTLTSIIGLWQFEFTSKLKENSNHDFYNQEIARLVQMIEEWLPPEKDLNMYQDQTLYAVDVGWNNYRTNLLRKFR